MSKPKKKDPKPFTRQQLGIIFKIAFLEAMALSIIVPTIQSSGELPVTFPTNNCNGSKTIFGRCEQSVTLVTITIPAGSLTSSSTVTYPTPFTNNPTAVWIFPNNVPHNTTSGLSSFPVAVHFLTGGTPFPWTIPAAKTEFGGNQHDEVIFDPTFYSGVSLTVSFDTAAIPATGSIIYGEISGDGGTTWVTLASMLVDGTASCTQVNGGSALICSSPTFLVRPNLPGITSNCFCYLLRIAGSGGDGVTNVMWNQITLQFASLFPFTWNCFTSSLTPKTSFKITCTMPLPSVNTAISQSFTWKAVSETG